MFGAQKADSIDKLSVSQKIILGAAFLVFFTVIFLIFPTPSVDWRDSFYPVSGNPLDPYAVRSFMNLPWAALLLYPLHFFSENTSLAINTSLNLVVFGALVKYKKGNLLSIFLTLTSFPFMALLANGGIEWIPAAGLFFQNGLGIFLLLTKPQSGLLAGMDWFLRSKNKVLLLVFPMLGILVSLVLWKDWPVKILANVYYVQNSQFKLSDWNMSLFPWSIPVGLGLVFYVIKRKPANGELLGIIATFCLVPYFAPHSLIILFALLSVSCPRGSIAVWFLLWLYPVMHNWSIFVRMLGLQ